MVCNAQVMAKPNDSPSHALAVIERFGDAKNIQGPSGGLTEMSEEQRQTMGHWRWSRVLKSRQVPWQGLAWTWSVLIVLICIAPHNPGPPSSVPWDKLAHFLLFAAFGALWLRGYPRQMVRIAIAGIVLGLAIEILQSVLGWGRVGDGADFAADCVGLFFALGLGRGFGLSSADGRSRG